MAESTGIFTGARGLRIFYRHWAAESGPEAARAGIVVIHGAAEHSGRYGHVGERYARKGFAVWAIDLRGLGQSGGVRGHVDRFGDYLEDVSLLVRMAREALPGRKVFLLGHSKGGLIALDFAEKRGREIDGAAVSAPLLGLRMKVPPGKAAMARLLSGIMPRFAQFNEIDPSQLARNPEVGRKYAADPLLCTRVTLRYFTELTKAMAETVAGASSLTDLPILMLQGGEDGLVDPAVNRDFFACLAAADKEYREFAGFYHEIFNEDEREEVFAVLDGWSERLNRKRSA